MHSASSSIPVLTIAVLLALVAVTSTWMRLRRHLRRYHGMTAAFIASPDFLKRPEWRRVRYDVLKANDGRCELCGRSKHDGVVLNVDHIKPRARYPQLALDVTNLQVLCNDDNVGKGNRFLDDWRHHDHPHRTDGQDR